MPMNSSVFGFVIIFIHIVMPVVCHVFQENQILIPPNHVVDLYCYASRVSCLFSWKLNTDANLLQIESG